ncbi:MAG: SpoIIE family protein phosphatase [Bacteroidales bacterium]|nr:SpoIIE family protein phosphatase [Bacteroidales bacterium]
MNNPSNLYLKLLFACLLISFSGEVNSQTYNFNEFGLEEGICDRYVYTISQDNNGYLWIGTGAGLCRFDGFKFREDLLTDSIARGSVVSSYKDRQGNLWLGHTDGSLTVYNGSDFIPVSIEEGQKNRINDIIESDDSLIYIATQSNGVLRINASDRIQTKRLNIEDKLVYSIEQLSEDLFLIGTNDGLKIYRLNEKDTVSLSFTSIVEQIPATKIQSILKSRDNTKIWIATEYQGIYIITLNAKDPGFYLVTKANASFNLDGLDIQSLFEDIEGNIWISTFRDGVIKLVYSHDKKNFVNKQTYNTLNGMISNDVKIVFQDKEGSIWIGTYGNGIARLANMAFTFYEFDENKYGNNITSIDQFQGSYWLGTDMGVLKTSDGRVEEFYSSSKYFNNDRIKTLYIDYKGDIWIGTRSSGIYLRNYETGSIHRIFFSGNDLENSINYITGSGDKTWVATRYGVFLFSEGIQKQHFTTSDGLPHNSINQIFLNKEGSAWISTISRQLFYISKEGQIRSGREIGSYGRNEFNSIVQDQNNYFWAATYGSGVFYFANDSIYNIRVFNGLKSDYCYSILCDDENNIWVGHRKGFSRISADSLNIHTYGQEIGIVAGCNLNSILYDLSGAVLFGTNNGLIKYSSKDDQKSLSPPVNNIYSVRFNDREMDWRKKIVLPYNKYKINIDFIGISFKNPEKVTYQHKLENYDPDWTQRDLTSNVSYPRIEDGNYTFKLRSFNSEDQTTKIPLSFQFVIKKPFWRTWWFLLSTAAFFVFGMIVIIKMRERNQKKFQAFLEKSLDERTKEVVEQKDQIEEKNKEITDSINYAQRIQSSILPSVRLLENNFAGWFMFYQPRDIVSGDFYWFDKTDDDRVIIVCADSTGHGVPGAFMSMIGSTLIKDIVHRDGVDSPSQIMYLLDKEITNTLTQNIDSEGSQDGMDMIVCEINLKTNYLRFSSAMRPVILYMKGEQYYIRGNRSSIGGEISEEKIFDDQEFQLSKGDTIYMFSDGYPDQFGGPTGKKFKMVRLKNMLDSIHEKPMSEQYEYIKNNFELWKSEMWQVDDVLFMGIRV